MQMRAVCVLALACVLSAALAGCCQVGACDFSPEFDWTSDNAQNGCTSDLECGLGFVCDPIIRGCLPGPGDGTYGDHNHAPNQDSCPDEPVRCESATVEEVCTYGRYRSEDCAPGWVCDPGVGCALPPSCEDGERVCGEFGRSVHVCAAGAWSAPAPCGNEARCVGGRCRTDVELEPDIVVDRVWAAPRVVSPGDVLRLELDVGNEGENDADAFTCDPYAVDVLTGAEIRLTRWRIAPRLQGLAVWMGETEGVVELEPSRYRIEARCDTFDEVEESDEDNNTGAMDALVAVLWDSGVDLELEELRVEATDPIANTLRVAYVLTNLGPDVLETGHTCALYMTEGELDVVNDAPLVEATDEETMLVPGAPYEGHVETLIPPEYEPGPYRVSLRCLPLGLDDPYTADNIAQLPDRFVVSN